MKQFWSTFPFVLIAAILVGLGYYLGREFGALVGFVAAIFVNLIVYAAFFVRRGLDTTYDVRPPLGQDEESFVASLSRFAARARIDVPSICIIEATPPNAVVRGYSAATREAGATAGLFLHLTPEERDAVAAHQIARFRNKDATIHAIITSVFGFVMELLGVMPWETAGGIAVFIAFIALIVAAGIFTILATLVECVVFRRREYRTDRRAAVLCGRPEVLIRALEKVGLLASPASWPASKKAAPVSQLFFVNPFYYGRWFSNQPTVEERVAALRRMAGLRR